MRFYKRDPDAAIAGMVGLTLQERGAYNSILDLLYSRDGLLRDNDDDMRRALSCHGNEWRAVKAALISKGKIWIVDGMIKAKRVENVLKEAENFSETQRKHAEKRWKTEIKSPAKNEKHKRKQSSSNANAAVPYTPIATASTKKEDISSLRSDISPPPKAPDLFEGLEKKTGEVIPIVEGVVVEAVEPKDDLTLAVAAYNLTAQYRHWPLCSRLTEPRRRQLQARLDDAGGIQGWNDAMRKAFKSSFLKGDSGRAGDHSNWRPNFDFFIRAEKFTKLMEGGYDDTPGKVSSGGSALDEGAARAAAAYG